jgi:hypothetical protein
MKLDTKICTQEQLKEFYPTYELEPEKKAKVGIEANISDMDDEINEMKVVR